MLEVVISDFPPHILGEGLDLASAAFELISSTMQGLDLDFWRKRVGGLDCPESPYLSESHFTRRRREDDGKNRLRVLCIYLFFFED